MGGAVHVVRVHVRRHRVGECEAGRDAFEGGGEADRDGWPREDDEEEEADAPDEAGDGGGEGGAEGDASAGVAARSKKAARTCYTLTNVPEALQRELEAFAEWRLKPINRDRDGGKVRQIPPNGPLQTQPSVQNNPYTH